MPGHRDKVLLQWVFENWDGVVDRACFAADDNRALAWWHSTDCPICPTCPISEDRLLQVVYPVNSAVMPVENYIEGAAAVVFPVAVMIPFVDLLDMG